MGAHEDPLLSFRFLVEIEGILVGGFSEVTGLEVETEVEIIEEGGVNDFAHVLPKGSKYRNIILKRGLTESDARQFPENELSQCSILALASI